MIDSYSEWNGSLGRCSAHRDAIKCICTLLLALFIAAVARAQENDSGQARLTVHSSLVMVPVLVTTKEGEVVFDLKADHFVLTDNGVPQVLTLEQDGRDSALFSRQVDFLDPDRSNVSNDPSYIVSKCLVHTIQGYSFREVGGAAQAAAQDFLRVAL